MFEVLSIQWKCSRFAVRAGIAVLVLTAGLTARAQTSQESSAPQNDLTKVSIENLMNINVTSVSKKDEVLSHTAAAIFVITQEGIRRSGMTSIPDLLRMVPGLDVAQIDGSRWAVSARGFNSRFSNKLLVLIDGRSLYSLSFEGVYWETQNLMLEDVERIEVIRGPGATVWGAGAVNGVINVITKKAKDTQGGLVSVGAGSQERGLGEARYGGQAGSMYYRAYAMGFDQGPGVGVGGALAGDGWHMMQGGFRMDWETSGKDAWSVEGSLYQGDQHQFENFASVTAPFEQTIQTQTALSGGNLLGRWTRTFSDRSGMAVQVYYDGYRRDDISLSILTNTVDFDFQDRFAAGSRHDIVWGAGYRATADSFDNTFQTSFLPAQRTGKLYGAFVQDEITLLPNRLNFTVGIRFEVAPFSGYQAEPSGRLLWSLSEKQAIWFSASLAARTPDRAHRGLETTEVVFPGQGGLPTALTLSGADDTNNEGILDFEVGYRVQATKRLSIDLATFADKYKDMQSIDPGVPFLSNNPAPLHVVIPTFFGNQIHGRGFGGEFSGSWKVNRAWKLVAGYSILTQAFEANPGSVSPVPETPAGNSPRHQVQLRSQVNLPRHFEFDQSIFFVSRLAAQSVPAYTRADCRFGWSPTENTEVSIVGQNLLSPRLLQFVQHDAGISTEDTRKGFAKITWRF
jgi:iron complex outermembrane receptor protein